MKFEFKFVRKVEFGLGNEKKNYYYQEEKKKNYKIFIERKNSYEEKKKIKEIRNFYLVQCINFVIM